MPDTPYGVTGCRCAVDSDGGEARWTANPHCPYHGLLPRDRTDTGVYRVVVTGTGADTGTTIGTPEHPVWPGAVDALNAVFQTNGQHLEPDLPMTPAEMAAALAPDSLDDRLRRGIEQAERGETVDRGDLTPDCEQAREEADGAPAPHDHYDDRDHQCCIDADDTPADVCDTPCWLVEAPEEHSCAHEGCTGEPGPDSVDHRLDEAAERTARISEGLNQRLAGCTCGDGSTDRQRSCPRHGYDGDVWAEGPEQLHAAVDGGMGGRIACACGNVWPCPVAKGPRCKGRGYCVYHDVPTVHDTGPIVAQKKPAEATADCTCLPGEGPCRCAELDEGLKHYEQPMPSDVVRKLVDFIKADEPARCDADACNYQEPHKHGFACDKTCDVCHREYLASRTWDTPFFEGSASPTKHLASGALRPALTAEEEKYYWLIHKPAWWRRLFRR